MDEEKKAKQPGRYHNLECTTCKKPFDTHSSNRSVCHTCQPKSREVHCFRPIPGGTIMCGGRQVA